MVDQLEGLARALQRAGGDRDAANRLEQGRRPDTEAEMSIVVRYAPVPSSTVDQYDEVMRRLQESGEMPADGFDYHVAFLSDGQLLVSEVWDSQEQLAAFGERIMPLLADVALEHSGHPEISKSTTSSGASSSRSRQSP